MTETTSERLEQLCFEVQKFLDLHKLGVLTAGEVAVEINARRQELGFPKIDVEALEKRIKLHTAGLL